MRRKMHALPSTRNSARISPAPPTSPVAPVDATHRLGSVRLHDPTSVELRSQRWQQTHLGYRLLQHCGRFFAVPDAFGAVCLADAKQRSNAWIISADNVDLLCEELDRRAAAGTLP